MARGLIDVIKESFKNKKASSSESRGNKANALNKINEAADEILRSAQPTIYTLAKENNIACKYGENVIITKDGNATIAVELKGASYAGISLDDETDYLLNRVMFFTTLKDDVEINMVIKKRKLEQGY